MRDAFGGTFMLQIFMVFFIIYVSIIGVAMNFAKIYRIKNNVINILEQNQYTGKINDVIEKKLDTYLSNAHYVLSDNTKVINQCKNKAGDAYDKDLIKKGICAIKKGEKDKPYYSVTVYYIIDFPVMNITGLVITSSGETIVLDAE